MTDFIKGKIKTESETGLFGDSTNQNQIREFSKEATIVFDSGRDLWKYYHSEDNININASCYEIREYFQGRNEKGRMNNSSDDKIYTELISDLRDDLKSLAKKIEPKVYEYGFLKK